MKPTEFTQREIEIADRYINNLKRSDMFPVRPAIGEAFVIGMRRTESSFINFIQQTELSQKDKDLVKGVFFDGGQNKFSIRSVYN